MNIFVIEIEIVLNLRSLCLRQMIVWRLQFIFN